MYNANTGWACGDAGVVIKTTDGGLSWLLLNSGTSQSLSDIQFVNQNTGLFCTRIDGQVFKSTNGGVNWYLQFSTDISFQALHFNDSLYGWVAEFAGAVFKTTDGGITWDSITVTGDLNDIQFIDRNTGWACGIGIYKTTNGGSSWAFQLIGQSQISSISFVNDSTGWAVDEVRYRIYKTTNSGNNWLLLDSLPDCFNAHHIFFSSVNTGWVSGDCGNVFKTSNGGLNWFQQLTGTTTFRRAAYFVNDSLGWSVGGSGIILKTTNGGAIVGVEPATNLIPSRYDLMQNYPNPFNPSTVIKFDLPQNTFVTVKVFNVLGELIAVILNNEFKNAGSYSVNFDGSFLSCGVYFYSIQAGNFSSVKKMVLIQ